MIRLFVPNPLVLNHPFIPDEKALHYLIHVMRLKNDEEILCFNGQDGEWRTQLEFTSKKKIVLVPRAQTRPQDSPPFLALCPALIKKDNFDFVLQKATELGVTDIYPLVTDHTVHSHFNTEHATLIIREAAEQSERLTLPTIHPSGKLEQLKEQLPTGTSFCYLSERTTQKNVLYTKNNMAFIVGPEGGWSQREKDFFNTNTDFLGVHFANTILRAETACIAILACWQMGRQINWKK